jgi:hypothetical protein
MIFFNSIINAKGTPSIYEDILANRPAASTIGRLFVATNSPYGIFRDQGSSWQLITGSGGGGVTSIIAGSNVTISSTGAGGTGAVTINATGGGGSLNWDQVLALGGYFSSNRTQDCNNFKFELTYASEFNINFYGSSAKIKSNLNFFNYQNSAGSANIFSFDFTYKKVFLGDFASTYSGVSQIIDPYNSLIYTQNSSGAIGLYFDFNSHVYQIGDPLGNNNGTRFVIEDNNKRIFSYANNTNIGIRLNFDSNKYYLGDYNNDYNGNFIFFNGDDGTINTYAENIPQGLFIKSDDSRFGNFETSSDPARQLSIKIYKNEYLKTIYNDKYLAAIYYGLNIDTLNKVTYLGDFDSYFSSPYLSLDAVAKSFNLFNLAQININGPITSGSSGGTSGQHLVVYLNGTQYKIQLRNP